MVHRPLHVVIRWPRGKWWDLAFLLFAALLVWLVFGGGRWILDLEVGF